MLTITDTITAATATIDARDIAATVRGWNPDAPADVAAAADDLQAAVLRDDYAAVGLAAFLAVELTAAES